SGAVDVFVDGFDEVCPAYKHTTLRLLELLMRTKAAHAEAELRGVLGCAPLGLRPLSRDEQLAYLSEAWAAEARARPADLLPLAAELVDALAGVRA
ncbi:Protein of unknown function, partial [Gryllus bimaculatus]